jgi:hydrogenase expression/formation protein HypE
MSKTPFENTPQDGKKTEGGAQKGLPGRFSAGKVPWDSISANVQAPLPEGVLLGPAQGEDAALVTMGGEIWAVASDPITFTSRDAGRLAVFVNANDVAVRGATPLFFTAVLLVGHDDRESERVRAILDDVRRACDAIGVTLIGGHTEVTPELPHTVIAGTMLGRVAGRPITTGGLRAGDRVGMTKWAGLEGTAILMNDFGARLKEIHGAGAFSRVEKIFAGQWISVLPEAAVASALPQVTALHDVTEGGVGEALFEMAAAAGVAIEIDGAAGDSAAPFPIPLLPETETLCRQLNIDPLGLIGSGSMLVGCGEEGAAELGEAMAQREIPFAWIGRAAEVQGEPGSSLPRFPRDEMLKIRRLDGIEACVFDMDGTLVDSDYNWRSIKSALGVKGTSIIDDLNNFEKKERDAKWKMLSEIERRATRAANVKPGAGALLELLRRKGIRTALVTNNSEDNTSYLLNKFGLEFDEVLTRDSGLYKPSGAPVAEAVRRLGAAPEKTLCVGDSRYDVLAARDAGCGWIIILFDEARQFSAEADLDFPDIHSFMRYLDVVVP